MSNVSATVYHRREDGSLAVVQGPLPPLVQLIQTEDFLVEGSDSQLLEYAELAAGYDPFDDQEPRVPSAGNLVFVDAVARRVAIRAEGRSGPIRTPIRVDAFTGWDARCMQDGGADEPSLLADLKALVGCVYGKLELGGAVTPATYASVDALLDDEAFHPSDIYLVRSPVWNLQEGPGDRGTSVAVRDLLLSAGLITEATAGAWLDDEGPAADEWVFDEDW